MIRLLRCGGPALATIWCLVACDSPGASPSVTPADVRKALHLHRYQNHVELQKLHMSLFQRNLQ